MTNGNHIEHMEETVSYGRNLHDKIRAEALKTEAGFANLSQFEKFVLDRGFYYATEEALKAAYDRVWKSQHGILITEDEFIAEAGRGGNDKHSQWDESATREVYRKLAKFTAAGKITNSDIYAYAFYGWCIRKPEAVIAYQISRGKWITNNCDTEISVERARIEVSEEFGFEASRVQIIGTPYYDATDYNFIRFNCRGWAWLMKNGQIHQVFG